MQDLGFEVVRLRLHGGECAGRSRQKKKFEEFLLKREHIVEMHDFVI